MAALARWFARNNQKTLLEAIRDGNLVEVQRLVDAGGVDLNPPVGRWSIHPLLVASREGHVDIVRFLLDRATDVNQVDEDGWTALIHAAYDNRIDVVLLLLQRDANVNAQNKYDYTALHIAAMNGLVDVIRVLLDHGADRTLKTDIENTAEDLARDEGKQAAADLLRDYVPAPRASTNAQSPAPQPSPAAFVAPPFITGQTDELASLRAQLQATTDELAAARAQHERELDAANETRAREIRTRDERLEQERLSHEEAQRVLQQSVVASNQRNAQLQADVVASEQRFAQLQAEYTTTTARLSAEKARAELDARQLEADKNVLTSILRTLEFAPQIPAPQVTLEPGLPRLGKGALGEVLAARYHGMPVAIKRLFALQEDSDYGALTPEEAAGVRRELRRECETLARLRSPFLVAYYGFTVRESEGGAGAGANPAGTGAELQLEWVVMERLEPLAAGPRDRARHVLYCLARALQYLHERGIIHRDVKPTNILYDRKNDVYKLSDLGEAQLQSRRATLRTQYAGPRGTIDYMAPEMKAMIEGDEMTDKIDVFSFAVTAVELLIGTPPTLSANAQRRNPTTRQLETIPEVERRAGDLARLAEGAPVKAMVIRCLAMNPEERPSAKECAEHFDAA